MEKATLTKKYSIVFAGVSINITKKQYEEMKEKIKKADPKYECNTDKGEFVKMTFEHYKYKVDNIHEFITLVIDEEGN